MLIVLTTTPDFSEGSELAAKLVESKLASCVQIVPQITSVYIWKDSVTKANEQLLLIKTTVEKYSELEKFISQNHSYDVPEIVAFESSNVSQPYKSWLEETLRKR